MLLKSGLTIDLEFYKQRPQNQTQTILFSRGIYVTFEMNWSV